MNEETKYKFCIIDAESLEKVVSWVKANRGITIWKNLYIGDTAGSQITPGDAGKPNWKYGDPGPLLPEEIEIEHRVKVDLVPDWYPKCEKCDGSGKRSLQELALIRHEPIDKVREEALSKSWCWGPVENDLFPCNYCRGTGHIIKRITFRVKRTFYGGLLVSDAGKKKSDEMCRKLNEHYKLKGTVAWDWEYVESGIASPHFFTVRKETLANYLSRIEKADNTNGITA